MSLSLFFLVAFSPLCPVSILRYHFIFQANVVVTKACIALSNLRNPHVPLSTMKAKGHIISHETVKTSDTFSAQGIHKFSATLYTRWPSYLS